MSYVSNDEIRGVLIQVGNECVLLFNVIVVEMMLCVLVQLVFDVLCWLVGEIGWYGWQVLLVLFVCFLGLGEEMVVGYNKVVVLKFFSGNVQCLYYVLLMQNFLQLILVLCDGLLVDVFEEILLQIVYMCVLLGEQSVLLLNLDVLEVVLDLLVV